MGEQDRLGWSPLFLFEYACLDSLESQKWANVFKLETSLVNPESPSPLASLIYWSNT